MWAWTIQVLTLHCCLFHQLHGPDHLGEHRVQPYCTMYQILPSSYISNHSTRKLIRALMAHHLSQHEYLQFSQLHKARFYRRAHCGEWSSKRRFLVDHKADPFLKALSVQIPKMVFPFFADLVVEGVLEPLLADVWQFNRILEVPDQCAALRTGWKRRRRISLACRSVRELTGWKRWRRISLAHRSVRELTGRS